MQRQAQNNEFYFLKGGGEMGDLIRSTDWSNTSLGHPEIWPQSLRTAVAIMLDNPFAMYIAWGKDYIQLYNNGYRPILGSTKHPQAVGISTRETFAEIWHIIGSMFEDVMNGKAIGFPNFMLPLNRHGFVEECYFDFSYSPIRIEGGEVGGILVTVIETTNKRKAEEALKVSEEKFRTMADNIPNLSWMANSEGWIFWYNKQWHNYTGTTPEQMEGWGWQSVHHPDELPRVLNQWKHSIASGEPFEMVFPLKGADGKFRHFLTRVLPVIDNEGKINQWFGTNTDITQQINMEESLKESEQRFRTMAEATDILIATSDETSNATFFNKAWSELTGRSMEKLLNFGWADLIHEEDKKIFVDHYLESFEKRQPWTGEFRMLNKNGVYRWLLSKGPVRFRPDGSFAGYISSSIDITERKEAEHNLQKSEQQLRSVIENAPFPIGVLVGHELRIELANQAMIEAWGKGDDVIGKSYRKLLPELNSQTVFQEIDAVLNTGIPFHAKNQRVDININGKLKPYYYNYNFNPLKNTSGKVYGIMNTAADVTDLNLTKQKIEQSERNFRSMILQAPVAMCILTGAEHIVEIANEQMIALWGKDASNVLNKPVFEALPDARAQGLEQLLAHVFNTGETFIANERPVELLRKGQMEVVYTNFVYEPYKDGDGTILGVLAVATEVTDQVLARRKIEEVVSERTTELANANENLRKSNAELAQFAYIASHDLQEPLRKISTYSQMLENKLDGRLDDTTSNYLSKINNSSSRMHTLIRDVLSYSELAKHNEGFSLVDLNTVVDSILTDYELLIEQKKASIKFETLPVIEAIPLQMYQLFGNLIGNALKFAKNDAHPSIQISVTTATEDEIKFAMLSTGLQYLNIRFSDNGIGFKSEYAEQIFNIFQRLHRKSEYEGTGIGLAMCRKIAQNHHGAIHAIGSSERGAVFTVILPVTQITR